jgi:hypothetical protein
LNSRIIALVALTAGTLLGCSKKTDEAPAADASGAASAPAAAAPAGGEVLPGASEVRKSLAAKKYQDAVGGLLALNQLATTEAQRAEFGAVFGEIRETLLEQSATDPKAAEALAQLRMIRNQR